MAIVRLRSADLKQALESGALSLHYQPQVVIATGKLECPRGSTGDAALTKALMAIQALGVRLASEEYAGGARASGKLKFDTLKIPFPISRDHAANADGIRTLVAEAKRLGARTVADSVETVEQEAALAALGVEI